VSHGIARGAAEVLGALEAFARDRVRPDEALSILRALRAQHELVVDLVWETDLAGTFHYDALLTAPGVGTFSFALCPEGATPWPLRGVVSAREQDVLRVNGETLTLGQVIRVVDVLWDEADVLRRLVEIALVRDAVRARAIEVDAERLQAALDAFRVRAELFTVEATERWMEERGLSHVELEELLHGEAATLVLRDQVADQARMDALWAREPGSFDTADLVRLRFKSEALAREAARSREPFLETVEREIFAGHTVPVPGGSFVSRRRRSFPREYGAVLFAAPAGSVVGPLPAKGCHDVVRVLRTRRAERGDAAVDEALKQAAFQEWLDERRREASVQWLWGTVEQTEAAGLDGAAQTPR
jgi:putative peptide maturation system protein